MILGRVNEYRNLHDLPSVSYDTILYKSANYHVNYIFRTKSISHNEDTLVTPKDRYVYFKGTKRTIINENISVVSLTAKDNETENQINDKISFLVVLQWVKSDPHAKVLFSDSSKGAVSTYIEKSPSGIKGYTKYTIYTVLDLKK